ncbi:septation protein A [Paramesorhizobium deserti]|uniref:Inner membrane-spanning protein YciB n=1 Tax=Paramesorhizobium deserti TaxID=1494590 RepID=A0A135I1E7_9HYPH|nr:septation protein A [Paramesorhizobium deserti]KXF79261.1 septation protein A [Paramesorhizobium deserti]
MEHPIFERDPSDPATQSDPIRKEVPPLLKLALELGPLLVFFFANARGEWLLERFPALGVIGGPIFIATALFMAATVLALAVSWAMTRTLPIMPLVSGIVVLAFGALTLWLHNDTFIKMKPTIVNTLFGVVLLGGLAFGKSLLGYVFDQAFKLDAEGWRKLTLRWGLFFLVLAVLNEVVWRNFSTDTWVAFKVWGIMPITIAFTLSQMRLIMQHSLEPKEDEKLTPRQEKQP